jgi:RHS repeat-associated protein
MCLSAAALAAESPLVTSGTSSLAGSPLVVPGAESLLPGQAEGVEAVKRANPEVAQAQLISASAYEGLSAASAEKLAREAFPNLVQDSLGGLPSVPVGDTITNLIASNVAQVDLSGGRTGVIESSQPIAISGSGGKWMPIDLGLADVNGAFEPVAPLVGVRIPKQLSEGVALSSTGVSLTPVNATGSSLVSSGVMDDSVVFYGDSENPQAGVTDLDTIVKPWTGGFDVDSVLRSADSPQQLYFHMSLPSGASLVQHDGSGPVQIMEDGQVVGTVLSPSAQDAEGTQIPVSMTVTGATLILTVDHRSGSYRYPIIVDPRLEGGDHQLNNETWATNWHFESNGSLFTGSENSEHKGWTIHIASNHGEHEWGSMVYTTKGLSEIWDWGGDLSLHTSGAHVESRLELVSKNGVEQETILPVEDSSYDSAGLECQIKQGPPWCKVNSEFNNSAVLTALASGAGTGIAGEEALESVSMGIEQEVTPEAQFDTTDETVAGDPNALYGNNWLGPHTGALVKFTASDKGIGLEGWSTEHTNGSGAWEALSEKSMVTEGLCSGVQCPGEEVGFVGYTSALPDGEPKLGLDAWDAMGKSHAKENETESLRRHAVRVDSTPPHGIVVKGLLAGNEIAEGQYNLAVQAIDGSGSTPSSGVGSIAVSVDGREIGRPKGYCSPGPCTAYGEWPINGSEFGAGEHKLKITATDNANNVATEELTLKVRHATPVAVGPGSVNPQSGAFGLSATDVSVGAPGTDLGVSRTYDSRRPRAGSEGPLGPQWTLSVGAQEGASRLPNGNVTLTQSSGAQLTFAMNGSGGFTSPTGNANLILKEEKNSKGELTEYVLKDPATGDTTRFTSPSGPTGTLWVPSKQEGILATETVRYTFQTVEVEGKKITEPLQELAPEPAGVSCSSELKAGCRALSFTYATKTALLPESSSEWEYNGRLKEVSLTAYSTTSKKMVSIPVADYSYDSKGRLHAEWDPRITPNLKTVYGYDEEGHVTADTPPGQQPWVFRYGTISGDTNTGRLLSVTRPAAATEAGNGSTPSGTGISLSGEPSIGTTMKLTAGSWSNSPLINSYVWEDCSTATCTPIPGADNPTYTPLPKDAGYLLMARITGTNSAGTSEQTISNAREVPLPAPKYLRKFGETGEGAVKNPEAVAIDASGNVWVVDSANARLEEFSPAGAFIKTVGWGVSNGEAKLQTCTSGCHVGTAGSGNGQFSKPEGIVINQSAGDIYVADKGNNRIQELTLEGVFVRKFGESGSLPGQMSAPRGLAIDAYGNVWVSDSANNRIERFSATGEYIGMFGESGERLGQFKGPDGIAFSSGNAYIVDTGNNRVQEFNMAGQVLNQFGTKGSEGTQFSSPTGIVTDPVSGDLYVTDTGNGRIQVLNPAGWFTMRFGVKGAGNGEYSSPEGVTLNASGDIYVADTANNRIQELEPTYSTSNPTPEPPAVGSSAVSTIEYQVPLSGAGLPTLTQSEVEKWAQKTDLPFEGTAIFPPDEPEGWPAKDYKRATIDYLDIKGRLVNTATPSGAISTVEYNANNDVERTLTPDNRVLALKESKPVEASELLSTSSTYNSEGTELLSSLGPQHTVKLPSGETVQARDHTVYSYDQEAPTEGGPYRLVTEDTQGAQIVGKEEADKRTIKTSYSGQENLGWKLRQPTSVTADPSGQKITHTTIYDPVTGNVAETRTPDNTTGESSPSVYSTKFGSAGSEGGQLSIPIGLAIDGSGNVWVTDSSNERIEEFSGTGTFIKAIGWGVSNGKTELQTCTSSCHAGLEGSGNGQFAEPKGLTIDSKGNLWIADTGNNRIQELSSSGGFIRAFGTEGTGNGQLKAPQGVAIDSKGNAWVADGSNNRIEEFNEKGEYVARFGTEGAGADQFKTPNDITISWGNIYVADITNNRIDELSPTGAFIQAFGYGVANGESKAETCTTTCQAGVAGSGNGQFSQPARITTDPNSGDLYIADHANTRVVEIAPGGAYLGKFGASGTGEGQFTNLKGVTVNAAGDLYLADAGNSRIEQWNPPTKGNTGAHNTLDVYYTAYPNPQVASCGERPEWAGLPCQTQPLAQPETSDLPNLPVTTTGEYNIWDEPLTSTQTVGSTTRTTSVTYDEAGRQSSSETKASVGKSLPKVSDKYEEHTGALVEQSTTVEGKTESLKNTFNSLLQMTSYTDASGNITTYEYEKEKDGRLKSLNDGKGADTYEYNPTTGFLVTLIDTAGTFTAGHDVEGNITSEGYPNGMTATYTLSQTGQPTRLVYKKETHCTEEEKEKCVWFKDTVVPSIHGQWAEQTSTLGHNSYTHDSIGRLTEAQDTPTGKGCITTRYAYEKDTNRTSLTTYPANAKNECAVEGGAVESHTYDEADRLTDAGASYDPFGDTEKLSAVDAGKTELTSSFYVDSQLASQTQNGETIGYQLDPAGRNNEIVSTGKIAATETLQYAGPGSTPSWTSEPSASWTRFTAGMGGGLVATQHNAEAPVLQLTNIQGDIVATASTSETATSLASTIGEASEYGVPATEAPPKFSWLGAHQIPTQLPSGIMDMGARSYVPQLGRFLQTDPIPGGGSNPYAYTNGDPVNETDLTGQYVENSYLGTIFEGQNNQAIELEKAREQAAREEAERKAAEAAAIAAEDAADSPTEGGPELPLGGYAGWECQDAEETGQEVAGCGGTVNVSLLSGPDDKTPQKESQCNKTGQNCSGSRGGGHPSGHGKVTVKDVACTIAGAAGGAVFDVPGALIAGGACVAIWP